MPTKIEEAVIEIEASVGELTAVVPSVIELVNRLATDMVANADEPAKILALAAAAKAHATTLAEKVAEHTVAEEEPIPPVEPPVA